MSESLPDSMLELPENTRRWLASLRPDELKTLEAVLELPAEDVRDGFKMVRDIRTVGRFGRWLIVTVVSVFIATVVLYEYILKAIAYLKGGSAS